MQASTSASAAGPSTPRPSTSRLHTSETLRPLQIPTRDSRDPYSGYSSGYTPHGPRFNKLLGSVLGSPYLTTHTNELEPATAPGPAEMDAADGAIDLVDGTFMAVPHSDTVTRPPSPVPTMDFSIISRPSSPTFRASADAGVLGDEFSLNGATPKCSLFGTPVRTSAGYISAYPGASYGLGLGTGNRRFRAPSPGKGTRGLLPRLLDALAASSPSRKGKGRAGRGRPAYPYPYEAYADLLPLDGEEGELIDEACFVDIIPPAGMDIVAALPPELALYVLSFLDYTALAVCTQVSAAWRALALDNLLWMDLFADRQDLGWRVDLRRAGAAAAAGVPMHGTCTRLERRASERSLVAAQLSRRASARSTATRRGPAPPMLRIPSRSSGPAALDWRELYKTRLALDRRWSGNHSPAVMQLSGHADSVYCIEFDSTRIITGSRDRTIKIWDLKSGRLLGTLFGHAGSVLCLKFDKDWDSADGLWPGSAEAHSEPNTPSAARSLAIQSLTMTRAGGRSTPGFMVSGSSDCSILVWNMYVGALGDVKAEVKAVLRGHTGGVLDLRMDGDSIVSCSKDALIRVWDRATLTLRCTLRGHEGPVNAVGLQSGRVVSASGDGNMILWDVRTGERLRTFEGHDRGLACIEFKDDLIVSGSNDCKIKVWSATTGACLRTLTGHKALVRALTFDAASGRLVSASYDRTVKLWDLRTGRMLREFRDGHTSHIFDVKFDVRRIVSTSHDQKIVVLEFGNDLDTSLFV